MDAYTESLKTIKARAPSRTRSNIPFAAAEGLSTYWYETTNAFGGTVLDEKGKPQFADPGLARLQGGAVDGRRLQERPGAARATST